MRNCARVLLALAVSGAALGHPFSGEQTDSKAKAKNILDAECTDEARRDEVKGTVVVLATIDTNGKAKDVRVVKSLRRDLDKRAVAAVKTWKFEPAKKNGELVMVKVTIEVNFDCTR